MIGTRLPEERGAQHWRCRNENVIDAPLSANLGSLVGACAPMRELFERIKRIAPTSVSVLLTGESGTGKELIAETIHQLSGRAAEPFVAVNCGAIPATRDLEGWTALDIGCNAGFYSIELAKRGARVVGIDVEPGYLRQARWAASRSGLEDRLTFEAGDVYQLLRLERTFDLVWFTGVFYHLRYPLLALDIVRRLTRRLLMFQTMTMLSKVTLETPPPSDLPLPARAQMLSPAWPKMAFIEHAVAGDDTNWWAPDNECVHAMLRSSGFRVLSQPEHEFFLCEPAEDPGHRDLRQLM